MAKAPVIDVDILSPYSMFQVDDMLRRIRWHCELLPELVPEKWNWIDPVNKHFDLTQLETSIFPDGRFFVDYFYWKRTKKPGATGDFGIRWESGVRNVFDIHANTTLSVNANQIDQNRLVAYVQETSRLVEADLALIEIYTPEYSATIRYSGAADSLATHVLRHWLPDVYWGTVFGPAYVRLFGKERLLSAPVFRVDDLGAERVYLQLTASVHDTYQSFDAVQAARARVKAHLGAGAFFDSNGGYSWWDDDQAKPTLNVPTFNLYPRDVPLPSGPASLSVASVGNDPVPMTIEESEAPHPFETHLAVLKSCGITLAPGIALDDFDDLLTFEAESNPYLWLLIAIGDQVGDAEAGRSGYGSDHVWYFDTECIHGSGAYVAIAERLSTLAKGDLPLQAIRDEVDSEGGTAWLSFRIDGRTYRWDARLDGDWVDFGILLQFANLLESRGSRRRFTQINLAGQDCLIGCARPEERDALQSRTGLKVDWLA